MRLAIAVTILVCFLPSASPFDLSHTCSPILQGAARKATNSIVAPLLIASASLGSDPACASPLISTNNDQQMAQQTVLSPSSLSTTNKSPTTNYLPRRLYPGTYKNYCGPTPETQVKGGCIAHGWYGDAPADEVDAACQAHDVAYCNCETHLLSRQRGASGQDPNSSDDIDSDAEKEAVPLLSSMVALRFATKSTLQRTVHADAQFFDCINKADRQLIATGIRIRGEQQRSGCSIDPNLAWFCDLNNGRGTLAAFERVNLSIFLRDLDSDDATAKPRQWQRQWQQQPFQFIKWWTGRAVRGSYVDETLSQLEQRRSNDLWMYIQNGKTVADAAASEDVISDEKRILGKLAVDAIY